MTTADIMLAQPGNPESFRDHEYDARTISWALLAAILIHLVVAFLLAAFGELPLPSQDGKDRPLMDFETNPHSLETKGAQPQQSNAAPQPKQMTAPQPAPITAAEQFALLTQKPTAASEPSTAASQAQSAYRRMKERSRISGNITSRGI